MPFFPETMLVVEGWIIDRDGEHAGYVVLDDEGRVVERGKPGTLGLTDYPKVRGVVLPGMVNGHTHLADAVWGQEPPGGPLSEIVRPPNGIKHQLLAKTAREDKVRAMRQALETMAGNGIAATMDFREEGAEGVRALHDAAWEQPVEPFVLGRPTSISDIHEVDHLLSLADGLGLSAFKDHPTEEMVRTARETVGQHKFLALHASEDEREPIDPILDLHPSLLVHLTTASVPDLERVRDAKVPLAFCPRSNALFGRFPPLHLAEKLGIPFLLGTDNLMFNFPDLFREMEFAYVTARLHHAPVKPESLLRAVFLTPWEVLGRPEMARLQPGGTARTLALRIPLRDTAYEIVARAGTGNILSPKSA